MVVHKESADRADRVFRALSDATRREIVGLTLAGDHSVSALARRFPMSFAAVQKHVAVLAEAGLVTKHRHGREQRVRGNAEALREARAALDRLETLWRGRIDRVDAILAETGTGTETGPAPSADREADRKQGADRCP